jgi:hypothetical protein
MRRYLGHWPTNLVFPAHAATILPNQALRPAPSARTAPTRITQVPVHALSALGIRHRQSVACQSLSAGVRRGLSTGAVSALILTSVSQPLQQTGLLYLMLVLVTLQTTSPIGVLQPTARAQIAALRRLARRGEMQAVAAPVMAPPQPATNAPARTCTVPTQMVPSCVSAIRATRATRQ